MRPWGEAALLDVRNRRLVLLGEGRGEVPGDHHVYIIFIAFNYGNFFKVFRAEIRVEIVRHKHFDAEADGIDLAAFYPAAALVRQSRRVFFECLRAQRVAGRPVVHIREKGVERGDGGGIVLFLVQNQRVEVVLVQIPVRQIGEKEADVGFPAKLSSERAAIRHTHAENALRRERRDELCHEGRVFLVLQRKEPRAHRLRRAAHSLTLSVRQISPVSTSFQVKTPFSQSI